MNNTTKIAAKDTPQLKFPSVGDVKYVLVHRAIIFDVSKLSRVFLTAYIILVA
jgi:hypothetical protein